MPPEAIRWIRPRDPWLLDRAFQQPLALVPRLMEGVSLYLEAAAQAEDVRDLFRRLEACGQLIRRDPGVEPTTFRCATVSRGELHSLRRIENVTRLGRVRRLGPDRIELAHGSIPADRGQVHVDCSAAGLRTKPARPVFGDAAADWIPLTCTAQRAEIIWATDPDLSAWMQRSRLNATSGMADHHDDPQLKSALARYVTNIEPAIAKLETLTAAAGGGRG